ncbi:hypothetical protein CEXT_814541 [Caerostris extrusa]|uniref:Uncharacterized protein n=1 Tax=Caerostris extrusa TaxID=172846 RepID=A0AAV4MFS9_CAEEX|nr:hypothetical protein CEXT_814541 [Caerostris extrusa]
MEGRPLGARVIPEKTPLVPPPHRVCEFSSTMGPLLSVFVGRALPVHGDTPNTERYFPSKNKRLAGSYDIVWRERKYTHIVRILENEDLVFL